MLHKAKILLIGFSLVCMISSVSTADIIFSDDFEISIADWDGRNDSLSLVDSESGGDWDTVWCSTQSDDCHAEISAAYGYGSTKGLRFTMTVNGCSAPNVAQEACFFGNMSSVSENTLYLGFRFKMSTTDWGTISSNKTLKMTRIYSGEKSIVPIITGDDHNLIIAGLGGLSGMDTGYDFTDTDWHTYVLQLTAGTSSAGIIRLWVDGVLEFENTTVDYPATTLHFAYFPMLQGNLSGGYNGPQLFTYWDDYIWATTKAEVDSFLGFDASPPAVPSGLHIKDAAE